MPEKNLPEFEDEAAEQQFWAEADSAEYVDWSDAESVVLPKLKPSLKTISLRLPAALLGELKRLANKRDIPYQSLLKSYLAERVQEELTREAMGPRA